MSIPLVSTPSGLLDVLNPENLLNSAGPAALVLACIIIFVECGLFIGFFLPGDSLLFTVGLLAATAVITTPIWLVLLALTACAIAGNIVGYFIGAALGARLLQRPDSRLFKRKYVEQTNDFLARHGRKAVVLARFTPIVRTFITAVAGVAGMARREFITWSVVGGVLWVTSMTLAGYWLGKVPFVHDHLEAMVIAIVLVSFIPVAHTYIKERRRS
ncbi:MAG: DedA family protein [Actinobacteria bacterium]|nr:DedA family protein [Actinomycetota bacterium]